MTQPQLPIIDPLLHIDNLQQIGNLRERVAQLEVRVGAIEGSQKQRNEWLRVLLAGVVSGPLGGLAVWYFTSKK